jgi:Asp-tRNA(Asn)/Glu-tRNA(Gln) amidotransferase C subunit
MGPDALGKEEFMDRSRLQYLQKLAGLAVPDEQGEALARDLADMAALAAALPPMREEQRAGPTRSPETETTSAGPRPVSHDASLISANSPLRLGEFFCTLEVDTESDS